MTPFIFQSTLSNEFSPFSILNQPVVMSKPHNSANEKIRKDPEAFTAYSVSVLKTTQAGVGFQLQVLDW